MAYSNLLEHLQNVANTPEMHKKFLEEIYVGPFVPASHECKGSNKRCDVCFKELEK